MALGARRFCRRVAPPHQPARMVLARGIAFLRPQFQRHVRAFSSIILLFSISSGLQKEGFSHLINNPFLSSVTSVRAQCVQLSSYTRGGCFSTAALMHAGSAAFQSLLVDVHSTNI